MMQAMKSRYRGSTLGYLLAALGGVIFAVIFMGVGAFLFQKYGSAGEAASPGATRPIQQLHGNISVVTPESGDALTAAVKRVGPAVANIDTTYHVATDPELPDMFRDVLPKEFFDPVPKESKGKGSGVIIDSKKGLVLTNAHVVTSATTIRVSLPDKREFEGKVLGSDSLTDIAVVQIKGKNLPQAELGTSRDLDPGSWAIAIGNPYGYQNTVTVGVVSALDRKLMAPGGNLLEHLIQTDASINPGNSGGPLCDIRGRIIGINTAIVPYAQGIGFSIAVDQAKEVSDQLIKHGKIKHPYIGVRLQDVEELGKDAIQYFNLPDNEGAIVVTVEPKSPAEKAGVQKGDVIREIDHKKIKTSEDVVNYVTTRKVGDAISLEVWRKNAVKILKLKLGDRPFSS